MKEARKHPLSLSTAGQRGVGWGKGAGESYALDTDRFLAADGIENIIKVLEELEDEKLRDLEFIELDACPGGCVGGTLQVENAYVAKSKFKRLNHFLPPVRTSTDPPGIQQALPWDDEVQYEPVFRLGHNVRESIAMVNQMNELLEQLPGLDCGSCGAPTCRARAEDIVRGQSSTLDCIHVLKRSVKELTAACADLADQALHDIPGADARLQPLLESLQKLGAQAALMDGPLQRRAAEAESASPDFPKTPAAQSAPAGPDTTQEES